jgi:catalase
MFPTKTFTNATGAPVADNTIILTAVPRGPALLQDIWLILKMAHFDREVNPERRIHAKECRMRRLIFCSVLILMVSGAAHGESGSPAATASVTPNEVIESLEGTFGVHPGQRRNHIKGTCAVGEFVGTSAAAALSRSKLFSGIPVPAIARFSVAGGNPQVPDSTRNARGLALEFRLADGSRQHMTMLNTPVFGAAHPDTFNAMIVAAKPDPAIGKPDPKKLREFLEEHPDALAQASFLKDNNPPEGYTSTAYFGIHTFKFVDSGGAVHLVKWQFVPRDGEKRLTSSALAGAPQDFLEHNLMLRLAKGPVIWDMVVYVGLPGDSENDPTISWPQTRKHFTAGTLTITQAMPQAGTACEGVNFDPLVMSDGIAPTDDPVLLFRSPAYAISFGKRISGN